MVRHPPDIGPSGPESAPGPCSGAMLSSINTQETCNRDQCMYRVLLIKIHLLKIRSICTLIIIIHW